MGRIYFKAFLVTSLLFLVLGVGNGLVLADSSPCPAGKSIETCLWKNVVLAVAETETDLSIKNRIIAAEKYDLLANREHDAANRGTTYDQEEQAIELRMALRFGMLQQLKPLGIDDLADLRRLTPDQFAALKSTIAVEVRRLSHSVPEAKKLALQFSAACDAKVAAIFGTDRSVVAASGLERGRKPVSKDGSPTFRFHLYSSFHIYSDLKGISETAPLFVPSGWTSVGVGGDTSNSSYTLNYSQLESKKNVTLNLVHLADANILMNFEKTVSHEYNSIGSVRVGSSGGQGGNEGGSSGNTGYNYAHSHIQIFGGDGKRFPPSEVFCSSLTIPAAVPRAVTSPAPKTTPAAATPKGTPPARSEGQ